MGILKVSRVVIGSFFVGKHGVFHRGGRISCEANGRPEAYREPQQTTTDRTRSSPITEPPSPCPLSPQLCKAASTTTLHSSPSAVIYCADQTTSHHWDWTGDPEVPLAGTKLCLAMPQPSVSGMEPPFGDDFQNYSFADQALTSTELLATSADPDFMYEL
eukprot:superscaffoldBa00003853_g17831